MKKVKSLFRFNKQERSGIFFLVLVLVSVQVGYFFYDNSRFNESYPLIFDTIKQDEIDLLKKESVKADSVKIFPFNPNFITDYKGYMLGMSIAEINRLHEFRDKEQYVNSAEEFQAITKISDSLLKKLSPSFKFPQWAKHSQRKSTIKSNTFTTGAKVNKWVWKDLNMATAQDLKKIRGIGEKLSVRIIKFRDRLGGFIIDEQLYDVYGLEKEVVIRALKEFKVINKPKIVKINVNNATASELSKLIYLQKEVSQSIVNYRNLNGSINSLNELKNIEGFPVKRIDRIGLYLSF